MTWLTLPKREGGHLILHPESVCCVEDVSGAGVVVYALADGSTRMAVTSMTAKQIEPLLSPTPSTAQVKRLRQVEPQEGR